MPPSGLQFKPSKPKQKLTDNPGEQRSTYLERVKEKLPCKRKDSISTRGRAPVTGYLPPLRKEDTPDMDRLSLYTATRREAIRAAQTQEKAIREKLRKDNTPFPPYKFLELIGKGAYGRVYKCTDLKTSELVALKVLEADTADYKISSKSKEGKDDIINSTLQEIKILQKLSGGNPKNINRILDAFALHSQIWIVNEYCPGGSISTLLRAADKHRLAEKYIVAIARELAEGLRFVHDEGIIHRDIKAANVMIHERGMLQIIDFGVAGVMESKAHKRTTMVGTPHWMPPELHLNNRGLKYGTEVDVWAYGCTMIECATGTPPNARQRQDNLDGIEMMKNPPRLTDETYSEGLRKFIAFILQARPADRPTMEDVYMHSYVSGTEKKYPTRQLRDLVEKFRTWEASGGQRASLFSPGGAAAVQTDEAEYDDDGTWNFSTSLGDDGDELGEIALPETPSDLTSPTDQLTSPPTARHRPSALRQQTMDHSTLKPSDGTNVPQINLEPADEGDLDLAELKHDVELEPSGAYEAGVDPLGATITKSNAITKEDLSVLRGERSLQAIFTPPTSDLPLRSGDNLNTHNQELLYDAGVGPSSTLTPAVDLSNVAQAKAKSQSKRKTMEWTFPKADSTAAINFDIPAVPRARPELRHAATAPVGPVEDDSGTLDLDAMWGDDYEGATAPNAYNFGGFGQIAQLHDDRRYSEAMDLDAMMAMDDNAYDSSTVYEPTPAFGDRPISSYDPPAASVDRPVSIDKGKAKAIDSDERECPTQGSSISPTSYLDGLIASGELPPSASITSPSTDNFGFTLRGNASGRRPPRSLGSFRRGEALPPMPAFPSAAMMAGASQGEVTGALQEMVGDLANTLGQMWADLGSEGEED